MHGRALFVIALLALIGDVHSQTNNIVVIFSGRADALIEPAIRLAASEIGNNASFSQKVSPIFLDASTDPIAAAVYAMGARTEFAAIGAIGGHTSAQSEAMARVLYSFGIPQISYSSESLELSDKSDFPFFLRTARPWSDVAVAMARLLERFGWTHVALVYSDTTFGRALLSVPDHVNVKITASVPLTSSNVFDVRAALQRIRLTGSRVILLNVSPSEFTALLKEGANLGLIAHHVWLSGPVIRPNVIGPFISANPSMFRELDFLGLQYTSSGIPSLDSLAGKLGVAPTSLTRFAANAYDAMYAYAHAANRQAADSSIDLQQLHTDLISSVNFAGSAGRISFDANGDVDLVSTYDLVQFRGGAAYSQKVAGAYNGTSWLVPTPIVWAEGNTQIPLSTKLSHCGAICGPRKDVEICVVVHGAWSDQFWDIFRRGVQWAAEDSRARVTLKPLETGQDLNAMKTNILNSKDCSVLVVSVPDKDLLLPAIKEVEAAGVVVYTVNQGDYLIDTPDAVGLGFVGQDEFLGGQEIAGRLVAKGAKHIVIIPHETGAALVARKNGIVDYCDKNGVATTVLQTSEQERADGTLETELLALFSSTPTIDAACTMGPSPAGEVNDIIAKSGKSILLATFDLNELSFNLMKEGKLVTIVHQDQYMQGYLPVMLALAATTLSQRPAMRYYRSGPVVVDPPEVEAFKCFVNFEPCKDSQKVGEDNTVIIYAVSHSNGHEFFDPILAGLKQGSVDMRISVNTEFFESGHGGADSMIAALEFILTQKVDALLVTATFLELEEVLLKFMARGIPIMTFNSGTDFSIELAARPDSLLLNYVGQVDYDGGVQAGQQFLALGVKHPVWFTGTMKEQGLIDRWNGLRFVMEGAGYSASYYDIGANLGADPNESILVESLKDLLNANSHYDALLLSGFNYAIPIVVALREMGISIPVGLFDFDPTTLRKIFTTELTFAINQLPYMQGYMPVILMLQYLRTRSQLASTIVSLGPNLITQENVDPQICVAAVLNTCEYPICPRGQYFSIDPETEVPSCEVCPAGSYQPTTKAMSVADCRLCPVGTANAKQGSPAFTDCVPCANNTFNSDLGTSKCSPCPATAFCPLAAVTDSLSAVSNFSDLAFPKPEPPPPPPALSEAEITILVASIIAIVAAIIVAILVRGKTLQMMLVKTLTKFDRVTPVDRTELPTAKQLATQAAAMFGFEGDGEEPGRPIHYNNNKWGGVLTLITAVMFAGYFIMFWVNYFTTEVVVTSVVPLNPDVSPPRLPITIEFVLFGAFGPCTDAFLYFSENNHHANVTFQPDNVYSCRAKWTIDQFSTLFSSNITFSARNDVPYANAVAWKVTFRDYMLTENATSEVEGLLSPTAEEVLRGHYTQSVNFNVYQASLADSIRGINQDGMHVQLATQEAGDVVKAGEFFAVQSEWHVSFVFRWSAFGVLTTIDRESGVLAFISGVLALSGLWPLGLSLAAFPVLVWSYIRYRPPPPRKEEEGEEMEETPEASTVIDVSDVKPKPSALEQDPVILQCVQQVEDMNSRIDMICQQHLSPPASELQDRYDELESKFKELSAKVAEKSSKRSHHKKDRDRERRPSVEEQEQEQEQGPPASEEAPIE